MAKGIWNQPGATERFLLYGTVDHAAIIYEHDAITHVPGLEPGRSTPGPRTRGTHRLIPAKVRIRRAQEKTRSTASAEFRKKTIAYKDLLRWSPAWGSELRPHRQGVAIMSTHVVDVFDRSLQTTRQWLHELESVVGPTSVGIGVESLGSDALRSTGFGLNIYRVFSGFRQGILL